MQKIEQLVATFLECHCDFSKPVLLGISGGPDSLVLFHVLLQIRKSMPFTLGLAHINHNWRPESGAEAEILQKMAADHGLPFHLKNIEPDQLKGNLEAACRSERLQFFKELCRTYSYQAVLLGHHAGDQAETVLKRIFEGAHLARLHGMAEVTDNQGITIWRPFLAIEKAAILDTAQKASLKPFHDYTNQDPRFLRGLMRTNILPSLENTFGKKITHPLQAIGQEASDLADFLKNASKNFLGESIDGPFGSCQEIENPEQLHAYLQKYIIESLSKSKGIHLSREQIDGAARFLKHKTGNKAFKTRQGTVFLDRGHIFLCTLPPQPLEQRFPLKEGVVQHGPWRIELGTGQAAQQRPQDWKTLWKGETEGFLPEGDYSIGSPAEGAVLSDRQTSLFKHWSNAKVPAFLRFLGEFSLGL